MPPQGVPPLLGLPPELKLRTFSYLVDSSFESIHSLLYVCKSLYDTVLPLSVHTYRNVDGVSTASVRNLQFLRYITFSRPELAQHVRCINVSDLTFFGYKPGLRTTGERPQPEERDAYIACMDATFSQDQEDWQLARAEWLGDFDSRTGDAELALLLVKCTRLTTLNIAIPYIYESPFSPRNIIRILDLAGRQPSEESNRASPKAQAPLSNLVHIYFESRYRSSGIPDFRIIASAFGLPRIRSFESVLLSSDNSTPLPKLPRRSTIEYVTLRKLVITFPMLKNLLGACKSLRAVEYIRDGASSSGDRSDVSPREFMDALASHAETLEQLHLDFQDHPSARDWRAPRGPLYMGLGLRQLTRLKRLVIGSQTLTGILDTSDRYGYSAMPCFEVGAPWIKDCIPESLESLQIHECGSAILVQVQDLLDVLNDPLRFPNLQRICLQVKVGSVAPEDLRLSCNRTSTAMEIIFQSKENRSFDLIPSVEFDDDDIVSNICTPIMKPGLRELWLEYRGSNKVTPKYHNWNIRDILGIPYEWE